MSAASPSVSLRPSRREGDILVATIVFKYKPKQPLELSCTSLLPLQDVDERGDICEVDNRAAITICFGLENTQLQHCYKWNDI